MKVKFISETAAKQLHLKMLYFSKEPAGTEYGTYLWARGTEDKTIFFLL